MVSGGFGQICDFLGTTAEALMDDSLMSQLKTGYTESTKPKYGVFAENQVLW